jgi:hypothetical protein
MAVVVAVDVGRGRGGGEEGIQGVIASEDP